MKLFRTINVPRFAWSVSQVLYPVKRAPTALRASMGSIHLPLQTWEQYAPFPSLQMRFRQRGTHSRITFIGHQAYEPVSATAKLQPVIPISALRNLRGFFAE